MSGGVTMANVQNERRRAFRLRPKRLYLVFLAVWLLLTLVTIWAFATGRSAGISTSAALGEMLRIAGLLYSAPPSREPVDLLLFLWAWAPFLAAPFGLIHKSPTE